MVSSHDDAPAGDISSRPRLRRLHALPLVVGIVTVIVSLWFPWLGSNTHRVDCDSCGNGVAYTAWQSAIVGLAPICFGFPLFVLAVAAIGLTVQRQLHVRFLMLLICPVLGVLAALIYYFLTGIEDFFSHGIQRGIVTEDSVLWGVWLCLAGYALAFIGVLILLPLYRQRPRSE